MDKVTKKMAIAGLALLLLLTTASAETRQYRIGDLAIGLLNVFGLNFLDFTSAIPEIITLFIVVGLVVWAYRVVLK
jgi:hypothetical protein